jgi:hypothetical protein
MHTPDDPADDACPASVRLLRLIGRAGQVVAAAFEVTAAIGRPREA